MENAGVRFPSFSFPTVGTHQPYEPVQQEMINLEEPSINYDAEAPEPVPEQLPKTTRPLSAMSFFFWYIVITSTIGIASTMAIAYTNGKWTKYQENDWIGLLVSFSPLIGLEVALGIPVLWDSFKANFVTESWACLAPWAAIISAAWVSSSVLYDSFNPLSLVFILATSMSVLGSMLMVGQSIGTTNNKGWTFTGGLTFVDTAMWCLLFIPLDYRWYDTYYWFGPAGMSYDWWALAITLLGVIGWGLLRDLPGFGYRLIPTFKDLVIGVGALVGLGCVVVPLGLWSGFLQWPPAHIPTFWAVFTLWLENVLTIAITEELFFRVVIMNGVNQSVKNNWNGWKGLLISSLCFGLMHWPRREGHLTQQILYASFAFVSGILYGQAYMLSGNNIAAGVITHSLTDTAWSFLFSS